jgi:hypothetical protein
MTLLRRATWAGRILSVSGGPDGSSPEAMRRRILTRNSTWSMSIEEQEGSHWSPTNSCAGLHGVGPAVPVESMGISTGHRSAGSAPRPVSRGARSCSHLASQPHEADDLAGDVEMQYLRAWRAANGARFVKRAAYQEPRLLAPGRRGRRGSHNRLRILRQDT